MGMTDLWNFQRVLIFKSTCRNIMCNQKRYSMEWNQLLGLKIDSIHCMFYTLCHDFCVSILILQGLSSILHSSEPSLTLVSFNNYYTDSSRVLSNIVTRLIFTMHDA